MPKPLVTDALWVLVQPLLPKEPPKLKGGRPRIGHRATLTGILFVLKMGIPWEMLPQEMGCGSGMTCWRRLKEWHEAGVWKWLHEALLDRLRQADRIDWSRASLDSAGVPAPGGPKDRPQPDGSRQIGLQAPPCGRPKRYPAHGKALGGQRPRFEDARRGGGRGAAEPRATGPPAKAAQAPEEASRRQRLRLPALPRSLEEEGHHPAPRTARNRVQRKAGAAPVGGGEDFVLAEPVPAAEGALRAAGRRPPGVLRVGVRTDLLELRPARLLGAPGNGSEMVCYEASSASRHPSSEQLFSASNLACRSSTKAGSALSWRLSSS